MALFHSGRRRLLLKPVHVTYRVLFPIPAPTRPRPTKCHLSRRARFTRRNKKRFAFVAPAERERGNTTAVRKYLRGSYIRAAQHTSLTSTSSCVRNRLHFGVHEA
jgi:hypothetical protein